MKIASVGKDKNSGNIHGTLVSRGAIPLVCDITKPDSIRMAVNKSHPDIIINPASKSKPTWVQEHFNDAIDVNFKGAVNLFRVAQEFDIPVIALSSDHIFNGKRGKYKENAHRYKYPVNDYGHTKLAMESAAESFNNVKIVRTSNCFWKDDHRVMWYINALYEKSSVPVPLFQKRSFIHIEHFAKSLEEYAFRFKEMPKVLHISGSKNVSWYEFVKAFADAMDVPASLSKKLKRQWFDNVQFVPRPKRAGLDVSLSARLGLPQYSYEDGLKIL